ncbi:hypothetical protein SCHPADRAFT_689253 [Schizopora paradoxa]|uniref:Uncharacterized protein n=1 Tax=Schizopora paradoxa TaxID=27342 RepID=A0A0H2R3T2_9AGAM|nr:hypothetical protein SCHPADRAFT_689253 [Schizopora paradoxa]
MSEDIKFEDAAMEDSSANSFPDFPLDINRPSLDFFKPIFRNGTPRARPRPHFWTQPSPGLSLRRAWEALPSDGAHPLRKRSCHRYSPARRECHRRCSGSSLQHSTVRDHQALPVGGGLDTQLMISFRLIFMPGEIVRRAHL